ncbi:stimulator of interferon genes protein isoform X3 [Anser cygnoides]|uniref:stimulator of interferon genes protein isoform X3 n=1 Tax=Anser cygnoides TaxID=8845 RepID=UPI0034D23BCE
MRLCPWHREQAQALLAAAASEGRRKRCLSGLGAAHSAHSARSPGSSRCRGRGRSDVSGTAAPEQPRCLAHPQGQGRASAARGVRPPGHLHRGAVPGWGAPVTRCPPPHRPPGSPADRDLAQGLLLPGRGDLPPPVQIPRQLLEGAERLLPTTLAPGPAVHRWLSLPGPAAGRQAQPLPCPDLPVPSPRPRPRAPGIKESMEEISKANPNVQACRETWKLHILIPLSCNVWDDLEKADSNIQYLTDLTETTLTRGGIKKRVYKHSFYAIRDGDNQARHCAVEYATPLQTLYAMSQDECAAFSRDDRLEQAKLFYRTLEEILRGSKECTGTYRLIAYEEPREAEPHFLSREILWHLRQQQQEEFTVHEGTPPRTLATALGSTDLSLQISASDLPQPLRSDHP